MKAVMEYEEGGKSINEIKRKQQCSAGCLVSSYQALTKCLYLLRVLVPRKVTKKELARYTRRLCRRRRYSDIIWEHSILRAAPLACRRNVSCDFFFDFLPCVLAAV